MRLRVFLSSCSWRALARFPSSVVSSVSDDRGGGWADTAHTTELQPFQSPGLFCVSCAFSRLSPALPVSDPGRSFYCGVRGGRGGRGSRFREPTSLGTSWLLKLAALSRDAATHSGFRQGSRSHPLLIAPLGPLRWLIELKENLKRCLALPSQCVGICIVSGRTRFRRYV